MPDTTPTAQKVKDCYELFLKYNGSSHVQIEREMRALGYARFSRRIFYSRTERGVYKPGWIERFGWRTGTAGSQPANAARGVRGVRASHSLQAGSLRSDAGSFDAWLRSTMPRWTWDWPHQRLLYKKLQAITSGESKRLMIFMPPRHGKSELVTVRYSAWRLQQDPSLNIILGSYNQKLANRFSRKIRNVLAEPGNAGSQPANAACGVIDVRASHSLQAGNLRSDGLSEPPASAGGFLSAPEPSCRCCSSCSVVSEKIDHGKRRTHGTKKDKARCCSSCSVASETQNPKSKIQNRSNTVAEWETRSGGGVRAVGVGAGVTGYGARLVIIDDPVKSRAEAESETYRNNCWDWFNDDVYTRLEPGAAIILIQTRWHEDDLAGRLLKQMENGEGEQWDVVNLPALAEPGNAGSQPANAACGVTDVRASHSLQAGSLRSDGLSRASETVISDDVVDVLGRKEGEALCPERFDEQALHKIKRQLGSYSFASLYQQRPQPIEGGLFKRKWFKRIVDKAPDHLQWARAYDLAVSTKTSADYTASFRCAFDRSDGTLYISGGFRKRIEFPEQRRYVIERMKAEPNTRHGIEAALHGQAFVQDLRRDAQLLGVAPLRPRRRRQIHPRPLLGQPRRRRQSSARPREQQ